MNRFAFALLGTLVTATLAASDFKVENIQEPWRKKGAAAYEIQGNKPEKHALVFAIRPQAGAFYRFSFQVNTDSACRIAILTTQKGTASYLFFPVKLGTRFATTYLYAQNDAPIIGRLYLDQTEGATRVEVKDFKVAKLTEEELAGNLFPDGEFESGTGADFLKTNSNNSKPVVGEIVPSPDFFAGEKSLELAFGNPGVENKLATHYLPMIPGKKMQLKFWAKSTGKHKLTVIMNTIPRIGSVHKGKHLFLTKPFTLDEEWKEYTLTFVPGENYDAVPDLKCHLLKLQFFTPEKESGKIWLDNVDYRIFEVK